MSFLNRIKENSLGILLWILLIIGISIPYIKNYPNLQIGGDLGFFEQTIDINIDRQFSLWTEFPGSGGIGIGKSGSIAHFSIIYLFTRFLPENIVQLITKTTLYSIGYWYVYALMNLFANRINLKIKKHELAMIALFFCTNLLIFDFVKSWLFYFYIFIFITPPILYHTIKFAEGKNIHIVLLAFYTILNMTSFANISYGAIQIITIVLLIPAFVNIDKKSFKKLLASLLIFIFINLGSIYEYTVILNNTQDLYKSSYFNKTLIEDYIESQKRFFNPVFLFGFHNGRIFNQTWVSDSKVDQFMYKDIYQNPLMLFTLYIPLLLIIMPIINNSQLNIRIKYLYGVFLLSIILVSLHGFTPLSEFIALLFEKISYLSIFRNSLKFSILLTLAVSPIILSSINTNRIIKAVFAIFLVVSNIYIIGGGFSNYNSFGTISEDYSNLTEDLNSLDVKGNDKCMIYPTSDKIWWGFQNDYYGFSPFLNSQNAFPCYTRTSELVSSYNSLVYNEIKEAYTVPISDWKRFGIKYIVLHKDINYGVFNQSSDFGKTEEYLNRNFVNILDKESYSIYKTYEETYPLIESENIKVNKLNPSTYQILLRDIKDSKNLILNKSHDPNWDLYISEWSSTDLCSDGSVIDKTRDIIECKYSKKIIYSPLAEILKGTDILESTQTKYDIISNKWTIEKEYITNKLSSNYYFQNADGSIDILMTLHFTPQTNTYLANLAGLLATLFIIVFYIYEKRNR